MGLEGERSKDNAKAVRMQGAQTHWWQLRATEMLIVVRREGKRRIEATLTYVCDIRGVCFLATLPIRHRSVLLDSYDE